jgi:adenine phosphoribosyltransferase
MQLNVSEVLDPLALLRCLRDFPVRGMTYLDVSRLVTESSARRRFADETCRRFPTTELVVGVEAMGLPLAASVADTLGVPLAFARKGGQIAPDAQVAWASHYRRQPFGVSRAAVRVGQAALIVDDVLATGSTFVAVMSSLQALGARVVGGAYLVNHLGWPKQQEVARFPQYSMLEISWDAIASLEVFQNPNAFPPGVRGEIVRLASSWRRRARDIAGRFRGG